MLDAPCLVSFLSTFWCVNSCTVASLVSGRCVHLIILPTHSRWLKVMLKKTSRQRPSWDRLVLDHMSPPPPHHTTPSTFFFPAQIHSPTSFQVARGSRRNTQTNVFCMMRTCSPNKGWATAHAFWHSGRVRAVCTERANWTSDHCHCH